MHIVLAIGPALGIVNHSVALSHLLADDGHTIHWITSPRSQPHLEQLGFPYDVTYLDSHDINFERGAPNRRPHLQQICDEEFLRASLADELALVEQQQPDLLITKHYYTIPMVAELRGLPFATYFTDGATYLIPEKHPHLKVSHADLTEQVDRVRGSYGLPPVTQPVPLCLESPWLNIVRGLPKISALTDAELARLPATTAFCGLLTFDGPDQERIELPARGDRPLIYITYGTVCYDLERYRLTLEAVADLDADVVLTTMHIDPRELGPLPPNTRTYRYVPNRVALDIADVIVHHGGHGTMLGALAAGTPQVVAPDNEVSTGQATHAQMVAALKSGVYVPRSELRPERLRAAIVEALALRREAAALAPQLQQASARYQRELCARIRSLAPASSGSDS